MLTVLNVVALLVAVAMAMAGIALFWIARQDDSRAGRLIGLLLAACGMVTVLYLAAGNHWF